MQLTYESKIDDNRHTQRDTERQTNDKVQLIVLHLFFKRRQFGRSKITSCNVLFVNKKNIVLLFNFDIVLKSIVGM